MGNTVPMPPSLAGASTSRGIARIGAEKTIAAHRRSARRKASVGGKERQPAAHGRVAVHPVPDHPETCAARQSNRGPRYAGPASLSHAPCRRCRARSRGTGRAGKWRPAPARTPAPLPRRPMRPGRPPTTEAPGSWPGASGAKAPMTRAAAATSLQARPVVGENAGDHQRDASREATKPAHHRLVQDGPDRAGGGTPLADAPRRREGGPASPLARACAVPTKSRPCKPRTIAGGTPWRATASHKKGWKTEANAWAWSSKEDPRKTLGTVREDLHRDLHQQDAVVAARATDESALLKTADLFRDGAKRRAEAAGDDLGVAIATHNRAGTLRSKARGAGARIVLSLSLSLPLPHA